MGFLEGSNEQDATTWREAGEGMKKRDNVLALRPVSETQKEMIQRAWERSQRSPQDVSRIAVSVGVRDVQVHRVLIELGLLRQKNLSRA